MSEQPKALALAEFVASQACGGSNYNAKMEAAAAELRRLHALNAQMLEALKNVLRWLPVYPASADGIVGGRDAYNAAIKQADAAISAAEDQA